MNPPPRHPLLRLVNAPLARLYSAVRYPRTPLFPTSFVIETTSRCNLSCRMCPRRDMRRPAQDMPPALFRSLIDQMVPHDVDRHIRFLTLHWFGEPLLHPQILDFIDYAAGRLPGLLRYGDDHNAMRGLTLSTNATLLDEPAARGLLDSQLTWLGVSVDGSSPETYGNLRCGGTFEQVMANVRRLLELNAARPPEANSSGAIHRALPVIAIQVIATPATTAEFAELAADLQALAAGRSNVRIELKPYTDWAGQVQADDLPPPDARCGFLYLDCGRLHDTLVIGAGGEIGLCCYDVQAEGGPGNANEQSIAEIWNGAKLRELRRQMRWGRLAALPLCRHCAMGRKYPADHLRRRKS